MLTRDVGDYTDPKKISGYYAITKKGSTHVEGGIDEEVFKHLKKMLPKNLAGHVVLDLGCGDGRWCEYFHNQKASVIGIDRSPNMLALAREREITKELDNFELFQVDIRDLSCIEDESIDIALASFCLMYFGQTDLERILAETARTLKKRGELYIVTNLVLVSPSLLRDIKDDIIPLELGTGSEKQPTENAVQTPDLYQTSFEKAGLILRHMAIFEPHGISVDPNCQYAERIELRKGVYKLQKP